MCKEPNSGNPDESQDDSLIETGLKAAFGPARPADEYHSVIDALGDQASRIHLANLEGDHSPLVSTQAAGAQEAGRRVGRYLVEGQIADGDAGPILKCRDGDLGREVAMKLLKKDLCDDLEAVRTFIEEAQIGAQLTHPGIIPVYELGLLADEQPYFTMKLVKGRPLSELLTERKDASDDLRRYLGIFEQICQAMAYAHTRDVIHRNLEPDNVLVGDYGEVKIIDWGFSRVKVPEDRSRYPDSTQSQISLIETIRGLEEDGEEQSTRVFGGPAYMSPEQAMGDVRRLDQRSDVFSLGAILFEIVTGRPPYTGKTSEEIVFKATRARLDWALTHLEESDVDRDLADIVRDSLSPAKQTRPRDARVLSDRITKWLGHAEEEARRGRIRAAEEQVAAIGARRARRLTVGVAAAVTIAILGGAGLMLTLSARESEARARADRTARSALANVEMLRASAESEKEDPLARWAEALVAVEETIRLARDPKVDPGLVSRVKEVRALIVSREAIERRRVDSAALDDRLETALSDIRFAGVLGPLDPNKGSRYAAAFEDEKVALDAKAIEAAFPTGAIRETVRASLEDWKVWALVTGDTEHAPPVRLLEKLDPDPDRRWILSSAERSGNGRLASAFEGIRKTKAGPGVHRLAGSILLASGDPTAAVAFLEKAVEVDPQDFWGRVLLGAASLRRHGPRPSEAIAQFTAAVSLRPNHCGVRMALGDALYAARRTADAERIWRDLAASAPDDMAVTARLGSMLRARGSKSDGDRLLVAARQGAEDDAYVRFQYGRSLLEEGEHGAALHDFEAAIRTAPRFEAAHRAWIDSLHRLGQIQRAIDRYDGLVAAHPRDGLYRTLAANCRTRTGDYERALHDLDEAVRVLPDQPDILLARGHARLGVGQVTEAIADLDRALELRGEFPAALSRRAAARAGLGDRIGAFGDLQEAVALHPEDAELKEELGMLLLRNGEYSASARVFQKVLDMEPSRASAWFGLGVCRRLLGQEEAAIEALKAALEADEGLYVAREELYGLLAERGELEAEMRGQTAKVKIHPADPLPKLSLALCYENRHEPSKALEFAEAAGEMPTAVLLQGRLLDHLGRHEDAEARYRSAVEADPTLIEGWFRLGLRCLTVGKFAEARAALARGVAEPGTAGSSKLTIFETLLEAIRMEDLNTDIERIRERKLVPETVEECAEFARLFFRRGEHEQAAEFFRMTWEAAAGGFPPPVILPWHAALSAWVAGRDAPGWRNLSRTWLRWGYILHRHIAHDKAPSVLARLEGWLNSPLRRAFRSGRLPEGMTAEEKEKWEELWTTIETGVEELRREVGRGR